MDAAELTKLENVRGDRLGKVVADPLLLCVVEVSRLFNVFGCLFKDNTFLNDVDAL